MRKMIVEASRALLGKSLEHATEVAKLNNFIVRVVEKDSIPIDTDHSLKRNRVNIAVDNGKVVKVIGIG